MARLVLTNLDFNTTSKIVNLASPADAGDAATKGYVDSLVEGLAWKDSARVSTQGNLNLSSPGATIDGITMSTNDRVLVRAQTTASQNGIYIWNGDSTAMTRSLDASTFAELEQAVVSIEEGTDADTSWRQTEVNGVIDTNDVVFSTFGTSAPSASTTVAGIAELATQAEVDAGTDETRIVTPKTLTDWSKAPKRYQANIGDGSATSYTVTHNLGTRDLGVNIYRNSGNYDEVFCDVEYTSTSAVTVKFTSAPSSNQFRVVIVG